MLADRIHRINPSATLEMTAKAAELKRLNKPVYNMSVGEPDFSTPLNIQKAAQFAIANDHTKYTPGSGTHELKSAIITKINPTTKCAISFFAGAVPIISSFIPTKNKMIKQAVRALKLVSI